MEEDADRPKPDEEKAEVAGVVTDDEEDVVGEQEAFQYEQDQRQEDQSQVPGSDKAEVDALLASGKINLAIVFAYQREERGLRYRREGTGLQVYSPPPPEITKFVDKWIMIRENAIKNEKKRKWMIEPWFELCKGFRALSRRLETTDISESELSGYEHDTVEKGRSRTKRNREQNVGTTSYPQARKRNRGRRLKALDPQREMAIHYEGKMPHQRLIKRRSFQQRGTVTTRGKQQGEATPTKGRQ